MGLRPGSHSTCVQKLYTQLKARSSTGCGWRLTYQQDNAEYFVDATRAGGLLDRRQMHGGLTLSPDEPNITFIKKSSVVDVYHNSNGEIGN